MKNLLIGLILLVSSSGLLAQSEGTAPEGFRFPPGAQNISLIHFHYVEQDTLYQCTIWSKGLMGAPTNFVSCASVDSVSLSGTQTYESILKKLGRSPAQVGEDAEVFKL